VRRYALALLVVALPAQAQMYKCVDEHGRTRYADEPGAGCKALDIRPSPPLTGEAAPRKEDLATQDAELKRRLLERDEAAARDREERELAERRCAALRRENTVLASGIPIVDVNSKGEKVYMDDGTRARRLGELASQLRSCP
jgi:Domain of unknown function (DUF4124)